MSDNPFVGTWTYRSLLNDPDVNTAFDALEFGRGTLVITVPSSDSLGGTIGGPGWLLNLHGSVGLRRPCAGSFSGPRAGGWRRVGLRLHRLARAGVAEQQRHTAARRDCWISRAHHSTLRQLARHRCSSGCSRLVLRGTSGIERRSLKWIDLSFMWQSWEEDPAAPQPPSLC